MKKDKAHAETEKEAKTAFATRVTELEAQMKKDKAHAETETRAEADVVAPVTDFDSVRKFAELQGQLKKVKSYAEQLTIAKAAADTRVSELEVQAQKALISGKEIAEMKKAGDLRIALLEAQIAASDGRKDEVLSSKIALSSESDELMKREKNKLDTYASANSVLEKKVADLEILASKDKALVSETSAAIAIADNRIADLESLLKKEKFRCDDLVTSKSSSNFHVAELEAEVSKGRADMEALRAFVDLQVIELKEQSRGQAGAVDTQNGALADVTGQLKKVKSYAEQLTKAKATADTRVSELEAQAKKDKIHLEAIIAARTVLQARVYELENSVTKAAETGADMASVTDDRVAALEKQLKQWKAYADQISKSKAVVDSRVQELEAVAVTAKDGDSAVPSDTVMTALNARVNELEAQAKKDKIHLDAIIAARTVLQARVYELENSVTKAEENGVDVASATDGRVAALETQLKRLKTYAEQLTKSKAVVDGRVLELEAEAVKDIPGTDALVKAKV